MKVIIYGTGGGFGCLEKLTRNGGASSFLIESRFPYHPSTTSGLIGFQPEKFVSEEVAVALADKAFERVTALCPDEDAIGIGYTCSLMTPGERTGREHRISICTISQKSANHPVIIRVYNGVVPRGDSLRLYTRPEQEAIVSQWIANLVTHGYIPFEFDKYSLDPEVYDWFKNEPIKPLEVKRAYPSKATDVPELILPGSFNPPTMAHKHMLETISRDIGRKGYAELSVHNFEKKSLSILELARRLQWMKESFSSSERGIVLTKAPLLADKVRIWTIYFNAVPDIVIGMDTWNRFIAHMDDQHSSPELFWREEFRRYHPTIHVFERNMENKPVIPLAASRFINPDLVHFHQMPPELLNLSSTEIRNARTNQSPLSN